VRSSGSADDSRTGSSNLSGILVNVPAQEGKESESHNIARDNASYSVL